MTPAEERVIAVYVTAKGNLAGTALYRYIAIQLGMTLDQNKKNTYVERVVKKYAAIA